MSETWPFWRRYLNFAQPALGARVLSCSDDFFGAAERLIERTEPVFIPGKYDDHGKWMDGWESRRRRQGDRDWCLIELGAPVLVLGVDIDTSHFNGNQPQAATLCGALRPDGSLPELDATDWRPLVENVTLGPSAHHRVALDGDAAAGGPVRHLRLEIFPDGGVARLRVYGLACLPPERGPATHIDLAAALHGGHVVAASDEHFGSATNLLQPGRGVDMGDGWETARRRGPGYDWSVIALGCVGSIEKVVLDTAHFKGNYPHLCGVQAALHPDLTEAGLEPGDPRPEVPLEGWSEILPPTPMQPDHEHAFELRDTGSTGSSGPFSHVRLIMVPDGGVSRLRVLGRPHEAPAAETGS